MKKAVTAILAVLVIAGALWFLYGQLKSLGYFSSPPPATQQPGMMPGEPGTPPSGPGAPPAAPAPGAPAPGAPAPAAPAAPATNTTANP